MPSLAIAAFLCLGAPVAFAHAEAEPVAARSLHRLAEIFGEQPRSLVAATEGASCGVPGHCSETTCNLPDCPPGKVPVCNCVATDQSCDDAHDPWNPFDNDSHALFDCNCGCADDDDDEPRRCTVYDPLDPDRCLVPDAGDHE